MAAFRNSILYPILRSTPWSLCRNLGSSTERTLSMAHSSTSSDLYWSVVNPYNAIRLKLTPPNDESSLVVRKWTHEEFKHQLKSHIHQWTLEGRSAVWLHIPVTQSGLVYEGMQCGFLLHHTLHDEIVLSRWLDNSRPNKLPRFASHQVGVCGVVLREDTNEILVTQDKYKQAKWKFPGGISEFAEDIGDTAEREVLEETGIYAKMESVIAFRQHHHLPIAFDQSDLYFICRMTPLTFNIIPCPDEVLKCQWVSLEELSLSSMATQLTNRIAELMLHGIKTGFDNIDVTDEVWPSLMPGHTYKLFTRTPHNK